MIENVIGIFQCPSSPALNRTVPIYDSATGVALSSSGGATDYFPHNAISSEDLPSGSIRNPALMSDKVQPLSAIEDGLSQTILIDEVAMRPTNYINGLKQAASAMVDTPTAAAWAGLAQTNLRMYNSDGSPSETPLTADCAINCNNSAGIYAFHAGGANSLFCDGSVHFLSTATAASVVIALATRDGSEIIPADEY